QTNAVWMRAGASLAWRFYGILLVRVWRNHHQGDVQAGPRPEATDCGRGARGWFGGADPVGRLCGGVRERSNDLGRIRQPGTKTVHTLVQGPMRFPASN